MLLSRVDRIAGLILCLSGLIPASTLAAPDLARATATVSARVLAPVSVGVNFAASTRQARLRVSRPNEQVFQLHIGQQRQHSYAKALPQGNYPLPITARNLKLAKNDARQPPVTIYFN